MRRKVKLNEMDILLLDIKKFLRKLESGQLEIEAGQWELHKDISNMKRSFQELKNLKKNVEEMRLGHAEQLGIIKGLEAKMEFFRQKLRKAKKKAVSKSTKSGFGKSRKTSEPILNSQPETGKKRKTHVVRSEEIIEINSNPGSEVSHKSRSNKEGSSSIETEKSGSDNFSDSEGSTEAYDRNSNCRAIENLPPQPKYAPHSVDKEMLQRYLKDSAKYCDKRVSKSTDVSYENGSPIVESKLVPLNEDYDDRDEWEGFSPRNPQSPVYRSSKTKDSSNSSETDDCSEQKKPKKVLFKANLLKVCKEKRSKNLCNICKKAFDTRESLKTHLEVHKKVVGKTVCKAAAKTPDPYRCCYCNKACSTPQGLTAHVRKCRIIMRSHFKKS